MHLSDFDALTFDCYGTLIDWESGIVAAFRPWLDRIGASASDEQILDAFSRSEGPQQQATPGLRYPELLTEVHHAMAKALGLAPDPDAARAFGESVGDWPAFDDSPEALRYLKQHYRLVILSNVDRTSFAESRRKLGVEFDLVLTAEDIGSYKPDPRNFSYLLERMPEVGVAPEKILHTAESLHHDHVPAKRIGLHTCWIHRRHAKGGYGATRVPDVDVEPDFRFTSLGEMAENHRREAGK